MSIDKSMIPLDASEHHGHARGIITLFTSMDTTEITAAWPHGGMALLSAERHVNALYEIAAEAESEIVRLEKKIEELEAKQ